MGIGIALEDNLRHSLACSALSVIGHFPIAANKSMRTPSDGAEGDPSLANKPYCRCTNAVSGFASSAHVHDGKIIPLLPSLAASN